MQKSTVSSTSRTASIRYVLVILFVSVYIILGYLLKLKADSYLLLGIPLMLIFQLFIVKQPIHKLWLRNGERFYLDKWGWRIALCLIILPIYKVIISIQQDKLTLVSFGYDLATILGAFCAGYCFGQFSKQTTKDLLLCFGITALIRSSIYFFPFLFGQQDFHPNYILWIKSLLTYIPIAFVVEEVVFRGMLDTYIQPRKKYDFWSALFISILWGLWHLPLSTNSENPIWFIALASMAISLWGILLSVFWRKSGNLAVPAFSHAFADAIRDALK